MKQKTKPSGRGGARVGAGRPPKPAEELLAKTTFCLSHEQRAFLEAVGAEKALTVSEAVRCVIDTAMMWDDVLRLSKPELKGMARRKKGN
jgi:hypothetical protein